jgi:hypothetical protein
MQKSQENKEKVDEVYREVEDPQGFGGQFGTEVCEDRRPAAGRCDDDRALAWDERRRSVDRGDERRDGALLVDQPLERPAGVRDHAVCGRCRGGAGAGIAAAVTRCVGMKGPGLRLRSFVWGDRIAKLKKQVFRLPPPR